VHSETAAAEKTERPDVATAEAISQYDIAYCLCQFLLSVRDNNPIDFRGCVQPIEMRVDAEEGRAFRCFIAADAFEDAASVVQRVSRDVRRGIGPGKRLAIHPYPFTLVKAHLVFSIYGQLQNREW
jgi:hypothetical protein